MSKKRRGGKSRVARQRANQSRLHSDPFPTPPWVANTTQRCPCGSGSCFAMCCGQWVGKQAVGEGHRLYVARDFARAEHVCRAELTQYIGSVYSQTLFLLAQKTPHPYLPTLIHVDVEALDELVGSVARCLDAQDKPQQAPALFDYIARFPLPGLRQRMLGIKAIWYSARLDDADRARTLLDSIEDIEKENDRLLLQIYLELRGQSMPIPRRLRLADMIVARVEQPAERLQYRTVRALMLMESGDPDGAWETVSTALGEYSNSTPTKHDFWAQICLARAYECRWWLRHQEDDFRSTLAAFEALPLEHLNSAGAADVLTATGELLLKGGRLKQAEKCLRDALQRHYLPDTAIHLADLCLRKGDTDQAARDLGLVDEENLLSVYNLEYYTARGLLALAQGKRADVRAAIAKLRLLRIRELLFCVQRDQVCIELQEGLLDDAWPSNYKRVSKGVFSVMDRLRELTQYLELKPNFFGLGVNLNRVIGNSGKDPGPDK